MVLGPDEKVVNEYLLSWKKSSELKRLRIILLTCDKPTASEFCRKPRIIENDRSIWRPLVRPAWFLGPATLVTLYTGMQTVCKNVPSTIWSKLLYISYDVSFKTFKPKWDFCVKSYSLVSWRIIIFASERMTMPCSYRCDGSEISTILNESNQRSERKKNFCRTFSRKTSYQEILCFKVPGISRAATTKKSDRKACVTMHV